MTLSEIQAEKRYVREERIAILLDGDRREPTDEERALAENDAREWERKEKGGVDMKWPNQTSNKPMPVQGEWDVEKHVQLPPCEVPEWLARIAYADYNKRFPFQTFERLHERGGFGRTEFLRFLCDELNRSDLPKL